MKRIFAALILLAVLFYCPAASLIPVPAGNIAAFGPTGGGSTPELLWLKLNEGTGTSTADDSGGSNTGTLTGGPTWSTGPNSNGAVTFDGTNDYIAVANEANFDLERTDDFSISMWVKWNAAATGNDYVFTKRATTGNEHGIEVVVDADNSRLKGTLINTTGTSIGSVTAGSSLSSGAWHHVVMTYDGSSDGTGIKLYIDNGTAVAGTGTLTGSILNDNPAWVARGSSTYYQGEIDDVRVYSRELTSGEVSTLYSGGAQ